MTVPKKHAPKRVLVFQHVAVEHPGIFRQLLADDGHSYQAVELDEGESIPALEGFDALWQRRRGDAQGARLARDAGVQPLRPPDLSKLETDQRLRVNCRLIEAPRDP